jgi:hypothetical protein
VTRDDPEAVDILLRTPPVLTLDTNQDFEAGLENQLEVGGNI